MWGSRVGFLVNILNFVLFQSQPWSPNPLCVAPEPGFPHSSVNGRINNHSPARIAFPGWVSLALAAGAAAARLRAPTQGPITPPWSCMITNLLPSLFFDLVAVLCSPKRTGAQRAGSGARGWCLFQNAHGGFQQLPSVDSERTSDAAVKELRNVLCATSVSCYHGNVVSRQQGRTTLPGEGPLPEHTGGLSSARRASLSLHPKQQGGAQPTLLHYQENKPWSLIIPSISRAATPSIKQKPFHGGESAVEANRTGGKEKLLLVFGFTAN